MEVRRERSGVRTRKKRTTAATLPPLTLAVDPSWQPARLFSITGVGNAAEQERRATSTLLSTMMAVREFGRALVTRFGGPAGVIETYLEVPFTLDDRTSIPDGVIRVARGGRIWTALLEVKTGTSPLRNEQVERYLDLARQQGYDAVITLSNDLAPVGGVHPVQHGRAEAAQGRTCITSPGRRCCTRRRCSSPTAGCKTGCRPGCWRS